LFFLFCFLFVIGHYQEGMVSLFDYYSFLEAAKGCISSAMGGQFDQTAGK